MRLLQLGGRAPKVRTLLVVLFAFVLLLPFIALWAGHVYENQLVRHTEDLLIDEAVVVGEVYRRTLDPEGARRPLDGFGDESAPRYHPFRALLDIRTAPILPRADRDQTIVATSTTPPGSDLSSLLERTIIRNLSGVRVLDARGIVVASPIRQTGYSLAHLPEVQAALRGGYAPQLRRRFSDQPEPPLESLSRAATIRVSLAIPIYEDPREPAGAGGRVIGAVYDQRTPLEVSRSLWALRHELYWPALVSLMITLALAAFLTVTISRPLMRLRSAAERVAKGERKGSLDVGALAPQEIRALSDALRRMRDQLESRADYIREFAANTAHELKTPLTSLRGASELLLEEDASMSEEQRRRFLENIHSDAVRMDTLVQRILHLARIESTAPEKEEIDLRGFLEGTVERYKRIGHELRLEYLARSTHAFMSSDQLDSLVSNLVDNAARHGANAAIELRVEDHRDRRRFIVRDHGPPLPPHHFEHVFERFYTTERDRGGTGLGLAIVKAIAEAHGGSVWVERHEEGGASFIVDLP
jgi:signal transduction histidine kinase